MEKKKKKDGCLLRPFSEVSIKTREEAQARKQQHCYPRKFTVSGGTERSHSGKTDQSPAPHPSPPAAEAGTVRG